MFPTVNASQPPPYPQDIPAKLVKKISNLEFVDMSELLPSYWRQEEPESHCCGGHLAHGIKRSPVTDILVWLDCYASLVAVLCSAHPNKIGHLMMYQKIIIKAQRSYVGDGWVIYDSSFRRKAANTKSLDWGYRDNDLFNEIFTGRAKGVSRCASCLSELHTSAECPQAISPPERLLNNLQKHQGYTNQTNPRNMIQVCLLYNDIRGDRCSFSPCKYAHTCKSCHGRHPFSRCLKRDQPYPSSRVPIGKKKRE